MTLPWHFSSIDIPVVYHYTSVAAARAMTESQSVWLSEYTAMNDASEFIYARDKMVALLKSPETAPNQIVRFCMASAIAGLFENTGLMIGSLTAERDNLGQWRSYANNGAGCVLAIDAAYLEQDAGVAIRTVLYDEAKADRMLRLAIQVVQGQYAEAPGDIETLAEFARHAAADLFNIKHPGFADEREIRIARMLVRADDGTLEDVGGNRTDERLVSPMVCATRTGAFGDTNYVALPLTRRDGSSAIVGVGLGPTMSADDRAENSKYFADRGIDIWHSSLPYRG